MRSSLANSFVLSIPAPAQLAQVDEHSMELYVVTPDGIPVARRIHAAVLVCVKTAAISVQSWRLGPLKEEDYMRLVKQTLEGERSHWSSKLDVEHPWPCSANQRLSSMIGGKFSPPSERGRYWWIGLA